MGLSLLRQTALVAVRRRLRRNDLAHFDEGRRESPNTDFPPWPGADAIGTERAPMFHAAERTLRTSESGG